MLCTVRGLDQSQFLLAIGSKISKLQSDGIGYGCQIVWDPKNTTPRTGRSVCLVPISSSFFVESALNWLPKGSRILWISHVEDACESLSSWIKKNFQDSLSPSDGSDFWGVELSEANGSPEDGRTPNDGRFEALLLLVLLAGWDFQILVPESDEFIDGWEGNIYFHSNAKAKLDDANRILENSGMINPPS